MMGRVIGKPVRDGPGAFLKPERKEAVAPREEVPFGLSGIDLGAAAAGKGNRAGCRNRHHAARDFPYLARGGALGRGRVEGRRCHAGPGKEPQFGAVAAIGAKHRIEKRQTARRAGGELTAQHQARGRVAHACKVLRDRLLGTFGVDSTGPAAP